MKTIGTIESLWRYPVKSMRGESCAQIFVGFPGVYGDRLYAIHSSTARTGFPFLNACAQREMLRYQPRFRFPEKAIAPPNLREAEKIAPGANPLYAEASEMMLEVAAPNDQSYAIDDPALLLELGRSLRDQPTLHLLRSDRALTDCRPLALISLQAVQQLSDELGAPVDKLRFRANFYLDLAPDINEAQLVGRALQLGDKATIHIIERDPRCMMVTLDPATGEKSPTILKQIAQAHGNLVGLYAATMVEGMVHAGDPVTLLDLGA